MNFNKKKSLLSAAIAGILGAGISRANEIPADKLEAAPLAPCYGVNSCKGKGACSSAQADSHNCAGQNGCKGLGWLPMPNDSCLGLEHGSLKPLYANDQEPIKKNKKAS